MEKLNFEKLSEEKQKDLLLFKVFERYFDALGFDMGFIVDGLKARIEVTENYFEREYLKFIMFSLESIAMKEHRKFLQDVLKLSAEELAINYGDKKNDFENEVNLILENSTKRNYEGRLYGYSK